MSSKATYCKKASFANEAAANTYIDRLKKTSTRSKVPQRAYLCNKCNNWHLSSTISWEQQHLELDNKLKDLEDRFKRLETSLHDREQKLLAALKKVEQLTNDKRGLMVNLQQAQVELFKLLKK